MIRHATSEDAHRISEIQIASWRAAYRGIVPEPHLQGLRVEDGERIWRCMAGKADSPLLVMQCDEGITGFCHLSPSRDGDTHNVAEIIALYIDPSHWRKGMGQRLCLSGLSWASDHGYRLVTLWTLSRNFPGQRFYEAMGFQADGASKSEAVGGSILHEVRYRLQITHAAA